MFSNRTKFWLMLTLFIIMGYLALSALLNGNYFWGVIYIIFTLFNYDSVYRLYKVVGGWRGATAMGGSVHKAFHEQKHFDDLD